MFLISQHIVHLCKTNVCTNNAPWTRYSEEEVMPMHDRGWGKEKNNLQLWKIKYDLWWSAWMLAIEQGDNLLESGYQGHNNLP